VITMMDFDFSLPSFLPETTSPYDFGSFSTPSSTYDAAQYDVGAGSYDSWFTNSLSGDLYDWDGTDSGGGGDSKKSGDSIADDIWGWAKTDSGLSTIGGAITGVGNAWLTGKRDDKRQANSKANMELEYSLKSDLARLMDELAGPSEAELKDKRIGKHNASINRPMNLSVR
jgi:hypothetical protein